ncbi:MAG: thioredoxin family protein [Planctomycetales bacterium]|nr:thioredoxin family protein [Planctomycetales bacterium]
MLNIAKFVLLIVFLAPVHCAFGGEFNPILSIGDKAPEWKDLPGVDGQKYSLSKIKQKVVVVVFTCNSCPYAVDYEDRIIAFVEKNKKQDVQLIAINVNKVPEDLPDKMKEKAEAKEFKFPYLFDETQKIARDYGAGYTPEFFVLDKDRKIVYMGAMDDSPDAKKVKQQYVQVAVDAVLGDGKIEKSETVPIGCRVRYDRVRRRRSKD